VFAVYVLGVFTVTGEAFCAIILPVIVERPDTAILPTLIVEELRSLTVITEDCRFSADKIPLIFICDTSNVCIVIDGNTALFEDTLLVLTSVEAMRLVVNVFKLRLSKINLPDALKLFVDRSPVTERLAPASVFAEISDTLSDAVDNFCAEISTTFAAIASVRFAFSTFVLSTAEVNVFALTAVIEAFVLLMTSADKVVVEIAAALISPASKSVVCKLGVYNVADVIQVLIIF